MRPDRSDEPDRESPPTVVGAVAAGTAPLPFLAVYAVMFIVHGGFHHVVPPDITSSNRGELVAGIVALIVLVVSAVALLWMLGGTRRWLFVLVQLATLATAVDFLLDSTKGGPLISGVLVATSVIALVLSFLPPSARYFRYPDDPGWLRRRLRRTAPVG